MQLAGRGDLFKLDVVICDNASQDESATSLQYWVEQQADESLHFLATGHNGGYAFGNNRGIEYLLAKASPDYLWILNNDTQVESHSLSYLLAAANTYPEVLIWGSTLVDYHKRGVIECGGGYHYCPVSGRVRGHLVGEAVDSLGLRDTLDDKPYRANKEAEFDYVSGASLFCQASVFKRYGLLSEDYFLYYEEYDFIKRMGSEAVLAWCPKSIVYHVGGLSTGAGELSRRSVTQQYYDVLNTLKFTYRYYKPYLLSVLLIRMLTQPALFLLRREWDLVAAFFRAIKGFVIWLCGGAKPSAAHRFDER